MNHSLYRKLFLSHVFSLTLVACFCNFAKQGHGQEIDREILRFVGEVLIGTEYDQESQVAMKWAKAPTLGVINASEQQAKSVSNAVKKINRVLRNSSMEIEWVNRNRQADIRVYFAPLNEFPNIAEREGFEYIPGNWGFFYCKWNRNFEINDAVIMLASDKLRGDRLDHFALEEITQTLGLPGDSSRFQQSIFYEDQRRRAFGDATDLTSLDAKLLRFLYDQVEPGTHAIELGLLMVDHWN